MEIRTSNRWHTAGKGNPPKNGKGLSVPVNDPATATEFHLIATGESPSDTTCFQAWVSGKDLHLIVYMTDTACFFGRNADVSNESIEIFFDFLHDHIGYFQFIFTPGAAPDIHHHLPYAEAKSSAFRYIRLKRFAWEKTILVGNRDVIRRLHAVFPADDVFRNGPVCGLNVCRFRPELSEASSWNPIGGMGFSDATSFGHLYRGAAPLSLSVKSVTRNAGALRIEGTVSGAIRAFTLLDPLGNEIPVVFRSERGTWSVEAPLDDSVTGRYRLYPKAEKPGVAVEPGFFHFDIVGKAANKFALSMTWDIPDDLIGNHYTPARLGNQIATLAKRGISRIYWLEYGGLAEYPALWALPVYRECALSSFKECGDLLPLAADLAKQNGMEFYGILKPFDLAMNRDWGMDSPLLRRFKLIEDIENKKFLGIPEIVAHREATLHANPDWIAQARLPVTRLRVFSKEPVPWIEPSRIRLLVSRDNKVYARYKGKFTVKQGKRTVPNRRWTPAGNVDEPGTRQVWCLELEGLKLAAPYAAITIEGGNGSFREREFLFFEATDASGAVLSPHLGNGNLNRGFLFGTDGGMWANTSEVFLNDRVWSGGPLGFTLLPRKDMPTLLEPACPTARDILLGKVKRILDAGAHGVDIRLTCHHNGCSEWLRYAFGNDVRAAFRKRFGRDIAAMDDDYVEARKIRGEGLTEFLRQAKAMTAAAGKKLVLHLEPGIEIPAEYDVKMQIYRDWKRWLDEDLPDQLILKGWTAQSSFIHEHILPRARAKGIETHILFEVDSRSNRSGADLTAGVATDAYRAGFSGYLYYETWSYYRLDPAGNLIPRANAEAVFKRVNEALQALDPSACR